MKNYTFKVTVTDTFCKNITVQGENKEDAQHRLNDILSVNAIEYQKNTLVETQTEIHLVPEIDLVENLFNIDSDEDIKVIRLDSLNHVQRAFLGLPE